MNVLLYNFKDTKRRCQWVLITLRVYATIEEAMGKELLALVLPMALQQFMLAEAPTSAPFAALLPCGA